MWRTGQGELGLSLNNHVEKLPNLPPGTMDRIRLFALVSIKTKSTTSTQPAAHSLQSGPGAGVDDGVLTSKVTVLGGPGGPRASSPQKGWQVTAHLPGFC